MEIALALTAALFWGFADFAAGLKSRASSAILVTAIVMTSGAVANGLVAAAREDTPDRATVGVALLTGMITAVGVTMMFRALALGVMGTVAPIGAAGVAIPVIVGLARGERPGEAALAGIVLIVAGVIWIARVVDASDDRAADPRAATILALLSAVTLGAYYVAAKEGAGGGTPLWFAACGQAFAAVPLLAIALARRSTVARPAEVAQIAGIGVANCVGWVCSVLALRDGFLAVASVLTALYPALTVVFAAAVIGERLRRAQIAAACTIFVGIGLIAAA